MKKRMNSTGDKILDTFLSEFREEVRSLRMVGEHLDMENIFETAVSRTIYLNKRQQVSEKGVLERIWPEEEMLREKCRGILLGYEKRDRLMDIRKTGVGALLDDFAKRSGFNIKYRLRGNSTVGISVGIPSTGQRISFNASFKTVLSDGWLDSLQNDLNVFMNVLSKFGKIKVTRD